MAIEQRLAFRRVSLWSSLGLFMVFRGFAALNVLWGVCKFCGTLDHFFREKDLYRVYGKGFKGRFRKGCRERR